MSLATVYWLSVFTRRLYKDCIVKHLRFCIEEKGMVLGAWIIMSNHVHLIFSCKEENPQRLLQSFKSSTARELIELIRNNPQESRKERYLWLMELAAKRNTTTKNKIQFWQQHNKPIELWSNKAIQKNLDYLHFNPVESGEVEEPQHYLYSSAIDYAGGKGMLEVKLMV
ncbi:transposase [Cytophagales bacterium LB-30]|uniref:Transposase n=1 Tax=Shiella aurantiaca TaxID=3058365 RepID=A0ABT8F0V6_9BACT|nr:transposase [Shiella aurantiaca]MDN4163884.1 transposase [Shiella aurantiaca]